MTTWYYHRWLVVCDDELKSYPTRSAARSVAARLAAHPANADIRTHGPYVNADGIPRVIDLGAPNPYRASGRPAYRYAPDAD